MLTVKHTMNSRELSNKTDKPTIKEIKEKLISWYGKDMAECMLKPKEKKVFKTYLVFDGNLYKIGKASDVFKRINTLRGFNINVELIHIIDANVETYFHRLFANKKVRIVTGKQIGRAHV